MRNLIVSSALFGCVLSLQAQLITGFENFDNGTQVMFRQPTFSGSTSGNLDAAFNTAAVTDVFPAGNPNAGLKVYSTIFSFLPDKTTPWVRLTSNNSPNLPNPVVDFNAALSFDIYVDRPLYVALALRETSTTEPIGGNGGTTGGIEFVGGVPTGTDKGRLVPANTWTTLSFNIPAESVTAFAGTTANGTLESTTGKGVLEALALSTDANSSGVYNVYLDNFQVAPAVPEPSVVTLFALGIGALAVRTLRKHS